MTCPGNIDAPWPWGEGAIAIRAACFHPADGRKETIRQSQGPFYLLRGSAAEAGLGGVHGGE